MMARGPARRAMFLLGCICLAFALASCDASSQGLRGIGQRLADGMALPGEGRTPAPTITPPPAPSPTVDLSDCEPSLAYVSDLTIPDGTRIAAGERFTKTWEVLNNGTCAWVAGFAFRFVDGEPMGLVDQVPLPAAQPGESAVVSVPMRAPETLGTYRSNWRLYVGDAYYGSTLFALIEVIEPVATATPKTSPTPASAPDATAAPTSEAQPTVAPAPTSALPIEPSDTLRAIVLYDGQGLWITNRSDIDWHNVVVELNPGLLRRGYIAEIAVVPADERVFIASSELRRPDGTPWPPQDTPWGIYLQADEGDYYAEPT